MRCQSRECGQTFEAPRPTEDQGPQDLCPSCVASVEALKVEVAAEARLADQKREKQRPGPRAGRHVS